MSPQLLGRELRRRFYRNKLAQMINVAEPVFVVQWWRRSVNVNC